VSRWVTKLLLLSFVWSFSINVNLNCNMFRKELSCFMRFPRNRGISPKKRETFTHVQYGLNLSKPPSSTTILHVKKLSEILSAALLSHWSNEAGKTIPLHVELIVQTQMQLNYSS
jgi:hypothetical protein